MQRKTNWHRLGVVATILLTAVVAVIAPAKPSAASLTFSSPSQPRRLAAGVGFMCMEVLNTVYCSGKNDKGQLGDGTTTQRLSPVVINSGTSYRAVSAGDTHTCGITTAGALQCWGSGAFGLLGEGRFPSWNTPMPVW